MATSIFFPFLVNCPLNTIPNAPAKVNHTILIWNPRIGVYTKIVIKTYFMEKLW